MFGAGPSLDPVDDNSLPSFSFPYINDNSIPFSIRHFTPAQYKLFDGVCEIFSE